MLMQALLNGDQAMMRALAKQSVQRFAGMEPGRPVGGTYYLYRTLRNLDLDGMLEKLMEESRQQVGGELTALEERLERDEQHHEVIALREEHHRRRDDQQDVVELDPRDPLACQRDPGEQSLTGWWLRSQSSFHTGEGIIFYDPFANPYSTTLPTNSYRIKSAYGVCESFS